MQAQDPPSFKSSSRIVLVDVVVKDKKGSFVRTLTETDFEVLEDGVPQRISSYNLNGQPGRIETANPSEGQAAGVKEAPRQQPVSILLLDLLNTEPKDRPYARSATLRYIEKYLQPDQQVAVFVLADKLMLLQDFTGDAARLKKAIEQDRSSAADPKIKDRDADDLERLAAMTQDGVLMRMVEVLRRFEANLVLEKTTNRVETTMQALRSITYAAGGKPGRKSLVWVSGAFPLTLMSQLGPVARMKEANSFAGPMRETSNLLNSAQIAVYPVDVRGLLSLSLIPIEETHSGLWVRDQRRFQERTNRIPEEIQGPQDAMKELASMTGGVAFYNRNDLENAINQAIEDNSQSYTLAYYPTNRKYDGSFRKITVKSRVPGAQLRYRRGYFALDRTQTVKGAPAKDLLTALEHHVGPYTQLEIIARIEPEAPAADTKFLVRLFVRGAGVEFWESDQRMRAALDFAAVALDQQGKVMGSALQQGEALLTTAELEKASGSGLLYSLELSLPKGAFVVRAGVRDRSSGRIGSAELPLTIP